MQSLRSLAHTFVISLCLSFGVWQFAPAGAPASFSLGFRHLVLIPFGVLCPIFSGGCLLHELLLRKYRGAAHCLHAAGIFLTCALAAFFAWNHFTR